MRRALALGVIVATSLAALMAAPARTTGLDYGRRILEAPSSGDEYVFQKTFHQDAQSISDRLYGQLASLLGGTAPGLNFVPTGSPLTPSDFSANVVDAPGAPKGTINLDPAAVLALIEDNSQFHSSAVNNMPHEMAHLHQTPQTLADLVSREGGAQAFTDLVTPTIAPKAHVTYYAGNYDGPYADYVSQVQQRGRQWILGTQFGNAQPVVWP